MIYGLSSVIIVYMHFLLSFLQYSGVSYGKTPVLLSTKKNNHPRNKNYNVFMHARLSDKCKLHLEAVFAN